MCGEAANLFGGGVRTPLSRLRRQLPSERGAFCPRGGDGGGRVWEPAPTGELGDFSIIAVGEGSKPSRFLISAERRNLFWGRGNVVAAGAAYPTSSLPFPAGAGKAATRGRVGARAEGLRTTAASTLQSAAADSSPYEGEPDLKGAARGGRGFLLRLRADSPQSRYARQLPSERGAFRLRAGRGAGGFGNPPLRGEWEIFL